MMTTALIILIGVAGIVAVLIVGGVMLEVYIRRQTTLRLRQVFGPEYQRVLDRDGDQRRQGNWRRVRNTCRR